MSTLNLGGCGVTGGSCYGDTQFQLINYLGQLLAYNDNGTFTGCGGCSFVNYTNTGTNSVALILRQACNPMKKVTCGGVSAYTFAAAPSSRGRLLIQNEETKTGDASSVEPQSAFAVVPNTLKTTQGLPVWLIIVIAVGGVLFLFLIFVLIVCCQRDPKRTKYHMVNEKLLAAPQSRKKTDQNADLENIRL
jgi:hypothetical protein